MKKKMKHYFRPIGSVSLSSCSRLLSNGHQCGIFSWCVPDDSQLPHRYKWKRQFFTKSIRAPTYQSVSAPNRPNNQQLISHRWRRLLRSCSAHQQVSQSESCSTDNQVRPMPLGRLVVRSVCSLANQREWLQSISHVWAQPVSVWQLAGAPTVYSCHPQ